MKLPLLLTIVLLLGMAGSLKAQRTPRLETVMCQTDTAFLSADVRFGDSLQWYRDGVAIEGAHSDTLITTRDGVFFLRAFSKDRQCMDQSGEIEVKVLKPLVNDDYVTLQLGKLATIEVLLNDEALCAPFDKSALTIVTPPAMGTILSRANGQIIYKPAPDHLGTDQFTYKVTDQRGNESGTATVYIMLQLDCAQVYPNPVENNLNITVQNENIYAFKIMDASGRQVHRQHITGTSLTVDMSHYSQGMYIVQLLGHNGAGCTFKVYKQGR